MKIIYRYNEVRAGPRAGTGGLIKYYTSTLQHLRQISHGRGTRTASELRDDGISYLDVNSVPWLQPEKSRATKAVLTQQVVNIFFF